MTLEEQIAGEGEEHKCVVTDGPDRTDGRNQNPPVSVQIRTAS